MKRIVFLIYGIISYLFFFVTILYAIGFLGNFVVPKTIDTGEKDTMGATVPINTLLLGLFAIQHTIMARPAFKAWWTRIVPQPIERSTFVLVTSLILLLLFWQWRPIPADVWIVWETEAAWGRGMLYALFALGWVLVFWSSFLIDHVDLFGLRQVYMYWKGQESTGSPFRTPAIYQYVRNPLMLGFLLAFWATPSMSAGHALFAILTTIYIFIGIQFEERDIAKVLGDDYLRYRKRTSMIIPLPPRREG